MSHARLEVRMELLAPFLQGTSTPYNMPVYPGAQCIIANALIEFLIMWPKSRHWAGCLAVGEKLRS